MIRILCIKLSIMSYIFYSLYIIYIYMFFHKFFITRFYMDKFGFYKKSNKFFFNSVNIYIHIFFFFIFSLYIYLYLNNLINKNFIFYYCYLNSFIIYAFLKSWMFMYQEKYNFESHYYFFFNNVFIILLFIHYNFCLICFILYILSIEFLFKKKKIIKNKYISFFFK